MMGSARRTAGRGKLARAAARAGNARLGLLLALAGSLSIPVSAEELVLPAPIGATAVEAASIRLEASPRPDGAMDARVSLALVGGAQGERLALSLPALPVSSAEVAGDSVPPPAAARIEFDIDAREALTVALTFRVEPDALDWVPATDAAWLGRTRGPLLMPAFRLIIRHAEGSAFADAPVSARVDIGQPLPLSALLQSPPGRLEPGISSWEGRRIRPPDALRIAWPLLPDGLLPRDRIEAEALAEDLLARDVPASEYENLRQAMAASGEPGSGAAASVFGALASERERQRQAADRERQRREEEDARRAGLKQAEEREAKARATREAAAREAEAQAAREAAAREAEAQAAREAAAGEAEAPAAREAAAREAETQAAREAAAREAEAQAAREAAAREAEAQAARQAAAREAEAQSARQAAARGAEAQSARQAAARGAEAQAAREAEAQAAREAEARAAREAAERKAAEPTPEQLAELARRRETLEQAAAESRAREEHEEFARRLAAATPAGVPWIRSAEAARRFLGDQEAAGGIDRSRIEEAIALMRARWGEPFHYERRWRDRFAGEPWYAPRREDALLPATEGEIAALEILARELD